MGAELRGEIDVFRLVEASDEIARPKHRAQHCRRIPRVGAEIAVAQIMRGKEWRTAGEIKHEIAARGRAIARRIEDHGIARGRAGRCIVVDREFEGAEMALGVAKLVEFEPGELTANCYLAVAASSLSGGRIEAPRVFARAHQDRFWWLRHARLNTPSKRTERQRSGLAPTFRLV